MFCEGDYCYDDDNQEILSGTVECELPEGKSGFTCEAVEMWIRR